MRTELVALITGAKGMAARILDQYATKWPDRSYTMPFNDWLPLNHATSANIEAQEKPTEWNLLRVRRVENVSGYWMRSVPAAVVMKRIRYPRKYKSFVFVSESLYGELVNERSDWWSKATQVKGTSMFHP